MKKRPFVIAGAASICLATLGTALPATAAPAASPSAAPQSSSASRATFGASLSKVTSTVASFVVTGTTTGGDVTVTDGKGITVTRHVYAAGTPITIDVPVSPGTQYAFTLTQTVAGQSSDPIAISVDTDITSLPAPTATATTPQGNSNNIGVRIKGAMPWIPVEVRNIYGKLLFTGIPNADGSVFVGGRGSFDLLDRHVFVEQVFGPGVASPVVDIPVAGSGFPVHDVAQPTIQVEAKAGVTTISATREDTQYGGTLVVRDANFDTIAQVELTGKTTRIVVPTPMAAQLMRVSVNESGDGPNRESLAKVITLAEHLGDVKPAAPEVEKVDMVGGTAVATVDTAKNAVVTVKDADGKVVALRATGTASSTAIRIPGATMASRYTVTQSTGSLSSDPTTFEVN